MAANPNLIGGGRYTRAEVSGDTRRLEGAKLPRRVLLKRLWQYLGRNRFLLVLALMLSLTSSLLSLYGPKLSGEAINAIKNDMEEYKMGLTGNVRIEEHDEECVFCMYENGKIVCTWQPQLMRMAK